MQSWLLLAGSLKALMWQLSGQELNASRIMIAQLNNGRNQKPGGDHCSGMGFDKPDLNLLSTTVRPDLALSHYYQQVG